MRRVSITLFLLSLTACGGADYALAPRGTGQGLLVSSSTLQAIAGKATVIPFDVQLPCGPGGPMHDIAAAAGQVIDPSDVVSHLSPPWQTADRVTYDCTENEWQRLTHVEVPLTPSTAGTYFVDVTMEPGVGTFRRTIEVH